MKNKRSIPFLILIIAPLFTGCRESATAENKSPALQSIVSAGQKYVIETKESTVTWKGSMLVGTNSHLGYVSISKGELMVDKGRITGGTVQVDMNTIEDEKHESDNDLIKHLKDPDFFDVKKFPVATFAFYNSALAADGNKKITGKLTIKGITKVVDFPARTEVKDGIVKMNGRLAIDRTRWDVRYKSGKFYDLVADQTMSDSIEFHINIVAKNKLLVP